ncbi:HlyD family secretion protein [Sediminibacterium soli]|uniref:HlyD family secretion protein n=1 Tax=Sediminibacterium soli TaxID=2698829 RepID=UPI00137A8C6E|nr:HlyD family efflux transporter periplasmic adaptor subunit [Sediminibacterium soli]NCI47053.1 HlyD family efflux transporter periplasmic adaptor subunit [Sediminibacterium soli]
MLPSFDDISYFSQLRPPRAAGNAYLVLLVIVFSALLALPFIYTDISIKAGGITRPGHERTETKAAASGIIDSVFVREGQFVEKNQLILRIRDLASGNRLLQTGTEIDQYRAFIQDLSALTTRPLQESLLPVLRSAVYTEQLNHFLQQQNELQLQLLRAEKEVTINSSLYKDRVISSKEFFDTENNRDKILASLRVQLGARLSTWQQELARYRADLSRLREQNRDIHIQADQYLVRAPVAGIVQGVHTRYSGGLIQTGDPVCHISPEETLIGECLVAAKDVGLLQIGQPARYQVEAFNHTYFGSLTGAIMQIDNDYTPVDNQPFFRVQCSFDSLQLGLKNGFSGRLKKGLNFQAAFLVARRSLWQLLFDKIDDWLNPSAPVFKRKNT